MIPLILTAGNSVTGQRSFSSAAGAKSSRSAARVMMGLAGVSTIAYGVHKYLKSDRPGFLSVAHAVGPTQQEAQNSVRLQRSLRVIGSMCIGCSGIFTNEETCCVYLDSFEITRRCKGVW